MEVIIKVYDSEEGLKYEVNNSPNGIQDQGVGDALLMGLMMKMLIEGEFQETEEFLTQKVSHYIENYWEELVEEVEDGSQAESSQQPDEKVGAEKQD